MNIFEGRDDKNTFRARLVIVERLLVEPYRWDVMKLYRGNYLTIKPMTQILFPELSDRKMKSAFGGIG